MLKIELSGAEAVRQQFQALAPKVQASALARLAQKVYADVRDGADRHTISGKLFASVKLRKVNANEYFVGHDLQIAPHAAFVVLGSRPHEIRARNKQALRFAGRDGKFWMFFGPKTPQEKAMILKWRDKKTPGTRVVFRWPYHPGYKGDNYLQDAANQAPKHFAAIIQELSRSGLA